jgi:hypothetical protein
MTTAIRLATALLAVTAMGAVALEAQTPAGPAAPVSGATAVAGVWRGPFVSDGPSGIMNVVIAHQDTAWKVTCDLESEAAPPGSEVREFKLEGNLVSWAQTFGDFEVTFKGTIAGDVLRGTIEAYQAGAMVGGGTFELKKQP